MLLYWGMFTVGFLFGSVLAFVTFAPKKPEDDPEYETGQTFLTSAGILNKLPQTKVRGIFFLARFGSHSLIGNKGFTAQNKPQGELPNNLNLTGDTLILASKRPSAGSFQSN